ncbi:sulfur carrier protein ThiS [Anaerovorax odorimutans]|uniref:sulfur carrier protein ThiS n=1 Tax=Anaerovorax odorimutans TaxID=109327 RepID=UPI00040AB865|nr:sulfur carrier protein ThiS [Anaerovorax odorimutans]
MAKINGIVIELLQGTTILQYLDTHKFNLDYIAVECNGDIIPKSQYNEKVIESEDIIEIVNFVGGG